MPLTFQSKSRALNFLPDIRIIMELACNFSARAFGARLIVSYHCSLAMQGIFRSANGYFCVAEYNDYAMHVYGAKGVSGLDVRQCMHMQYLHCAI